MSDIHWVPDQLARQCAVCERKFSFLVRKHHCRQCGGCVCDACSPHLVALPLLGLKEPSRVCSPCFAANHTKLQQQSAGRMTLVTGDGAGPSLATASNKSSRLPFATPALPLPSDVDPDSTAASCVSNSNRKYSSSSSPDADEAVRLHFTSSIYARERVAFTSPASSSSDGISVPSFSFALADSAFARAAAALAATRRLPFKLLTGETVALHLAPVVWVCGPDGADGDADDGTSSTSSLDGRSAAAAHRDAGDSDVLSSAIDSAAAIASTVSGAAAAPVSQRSRAAILRDEMPRRVNALFFAASSGTPKSQDSSVVNAQLFGESNDAKASASPPPALSSAEPIAPPLATAAPVAPAAHRSAPKPSAASTRLFHMLTSAADASTSAFGGADDDEWLLKEPVVAPKPLAVNLVAAPALFGSPPLQQAASTAAFTEAVSRPSSMGHSYAATASAANDAAAETARLRAAFDVAPAYERSAFDLWAGHLVLTNYRLLFVPVMPVPLPPAHIDASSASPSVSVSSSLSPMAAAASSSSFPASPSHAAGTPSPASAPPPASLPPLPACRSIPWLSLRRVEQQARPLAWLGADSAWLRVSNDTGASRSSNIAVDDGTSSSNNGSNNGSNAQTSAAAAANRESDHAGAGLRVRLLFLGLSRRHCYTALQEAAAFIAQRVAPARAADVFAFANREQASVPLPLSIRRDDSWLLARERVASERRGGGHRVAGIGRNSASDDGMAMSGTSWSRPVADAFDEVDASAVLRSEFKRLGFCNESGGGAAWRISTVNSAFQFCATYPPVLLVPASVTDEDLARVAPYRARARVPVAVWRHPRTGALLMRASQPRPGVLGNTRCAADEELIRAAVVASNSGAWGDLVIVDARPLLNAHANRLRDGGGGFETAAHYQSVRPTHMALRASISGAVGSSTVATGASASVSDASLFAGNTRLGRTSGIGSAGGASASASASVSGPLVMGWTGVRHCRVEHCGIDNIHDVAAAYRAVQALAARVADCAQFADSGHDGVAHPGDISEGSMRAQAYASRAIPSGAVWSQLQAGVAASKWTEHVARILHHAARIAALLDAGASRGGGIDAGGSGSGRGSASSSASGSTSSGRITSANSGSSTSANINVGCSDSADITSTNASASAASGGNVCVLVHCSDGWDRTAQLVSLAQLMLEPYFRTIEGFEVLIEKEWVAFGHRFAERGGSVGGILSMDESGAKASNHVNSKAAPVFALFIDCVWQLQQQHPTAFEFNGRYLCCLLNGAASGRFGTLLFDSLADRVAARCSAAHAIALPVDGGNAAPRSGSSSDPARSSSGSGSSASGGESASAGTRPGRAALPSLWTWLRARGDRVRNPAFALSSQSNATDADVPLSRAIHRLAFDAAAVRFWAPYHLQHTRADRFTPPQHTRYRHQHFHHLDCAHHGSGGDSDEDSDDDSGHCRYSDPAERVVRAALKNARRAQTGAREWERVWAASLCRDVLLRRWAAAAVDASAAQCAGNGSK